MLNGYFAVLYLYAFFAMHNVILYLTPSDLPTIQEEKEENATAMDLEAEPKQVTKTDDESKPIIRKINEFRLW